MKLKLYAFYPETLKSAGRPHLQATKQSLIMKHCRPVLLFIAYKGSKLWEIFGKNKNNKIYTISLHRVLHNKALQYTRKQRNVHFPQQEINCTTSIGIPLKQNAFHKCLKQFIVLILTFTFRSATLTELHSCNKLNKSQKLHSTGSSTHYHLQFFSSLVYFA